MGVSGVEQELGLGVDGGQLPVEEGHGLPHPGGVAALCVIHYHWLTYLHIYNIDIYISAAVTVCT